MPEKSVRTAKLDLRLSSEAKEKLQAAAIASQRSVSEFVLESALARADETLTGRFHFGLDADRWSDFLSALDAEPRAGAIGGGDLPSRARFSSLSKKGSDPLEGIVITLKS